MQTKKRKMNAGEALVGMKRRGSQLGRVLALRQTVDEVKRVVVRRTFVGRT